MFSKLKNFKVVLGYKSLVAIVLFAAGTVTGAAFATIPDDSGVIHTCYRNTLLSKTFRVIDSPSQTCNANETTLSWDQQGGKVTYATQTQTITVAEEGVVDFAYDIACPAGYIAMGGLYQKVSGDLTFINAPHPVYLGYHFESESSSDPDSSSLTTWHFGYQTSQPELTVGQSQVAKFTVVCSPSGPLPF